MVTFVYINTTQMILSFLRLRQKMGSWYLILIYESHYKIDYLKWEVNAFLTSLQSPIFNDQTISNITDKIFQCHLQIIRQNWYQTF